LHVLSMRELHQTQTSIRQTEYGLARVRDLTMSELEMHGDVAAVKEKKNLQEALASWEIREIFSRRCRNWPNGKI
jgi:hypothetical protein